MDEIEIVESDVWIYKQINAILSASTSSRSLVHCFSRARYMGVVEIRTSDSKKEWVENAKMT